MSSEMIGVTMVSVVTLALGSTLSSAMTESLASVALSVAASLFSTSIYSTTGGSGTITFSSRMTGSLPGGVASLSSPFSSYFSSSVDDAGMSSVALASDSEADAEVVASGNT